MKALPHLTYGLLVAVQNSFSISARRAWRKREHKDRLYSLLLKLGARKHYNPSPQDSICIFQYFAFLPLADRDAYSTPCALSPISQACSSPDIADTGRRQKHHPSHALPHVGYRLHHKGLAFLVRRSNERYDPIFCFVVCQVGTLVWICR